MFKYKIITNHQRNLPISVSIFVKVSKSKRAFHTFHPVTILADTILSYSVISLRIESNLLVPNRDPEQETSARGTSASHPTAANAEPRDSLGTFELPQRGGGEQRRSKEREGWMGGWEQDGHDQFGHGE